MGFVAAGDYRLPVTNPATKLTPAKAQTPFVRVTVVDEDLNGLVITPRFRESRSTDDRPRAIGVNDVSGYGGRIQNFSSGLGV
jgi:hypothetical protein